MAKKETKKDIKEMTLAELRKEAQDLVVLAQTSYKNGKFKQMMDADKKTDEVVAQYAITKKDEVFLALKKQKNPMLEAVKQLRYKVITIKRVTIEGTKEKERTVDEKECAINLIDLNKFCGGTLGTNPEWLAGLKFFAACLIARHGNDLKKPVDAVKASKAFVGVSAEIKEKILNGRTVEEACSDAGLVQTLNALITLMIGEEYAKVETDFAQWLLKVSVKRGREVASLKFIGERILTDVLAEVMHCIILNKPITLEYKLK